ncbi:MAG TPA: YitT family protein, partial [Thermomicrobiaceae bacterium]|nr:YitT family protein [Thermomicrobiaceae bacterium]
MSDNSLKYIVSRFLGGGKGRSGAVFIPPVAPSLLNIRGWSRRDYGRWSVQFVELLIGLTLFAIGVVLSLQCNLGANSWTVFQDGISRRTPITIGQASQIVGIVMIGVSWLVSGIRPGLGTIINMYLIGAEMDLILEHNWIPLAGAYPIRIAMMFGSLAVLGLATGLYIRAGFGAGPRDSFNIAVTQRTGLPISLTRWGIETTVVIIGILLGGDFGIGTIIAALLIGPAVGIGFRMAGLSSSTAVEENEAEMLAG